jgi:hypothetical protein
MSKRVYIYVQNEFPIGQVAEIIDQKACRSYGVQDSSCVMYARTYGYIGLTAHTHVASVSVTDCTRDVVCMHARMDTSV